MEEYNDWNLHPEEEAIIEISVGGEVFDLEPHNTELYQHIGKLAMYDCVYHESDEEDKAMYIFKEQGVFEELAENMIEMGFPCYIAMREVHEDIRKHYENMLIRMMWDSVPDELKGEEE